VDADARRATLAATSRIQRGHPAVPDSVDLDAEQTWPLAQALRTHAPHLVSLDPERFGALPATAGRSPQQAIAVRIAAAGHAGQSGVLVLGLNALRMFDDNFRRFVELVASQIAASLANAHAHEEERRRAESLAELDRAKTAFFSNVSHEFRTPLTLMLAPIDELLQQPNTAAARVHDLLPVMRRSAQRLLRLVNTLLDFSRIEAGRAQASYEPVDLSSYTIELASVFRAAVEKAGMQLLIDCPPLPQPVHVDRDMWEKIVLNLLSNAFKYTFEGEIRVSLRPGAGGVTLAVSDTGIGIAAEELPRVFERFYRVEGARGRTHEGSGIGLALAQELLKLHGGQLRVESAPGAGSTFSVTIPFGTAHLPAERIGASRGLASTALRADAFVEEVLQWLPNADDSLFLSETATIVLPADTRAGERETVLIADDNADMRDYLRRLIAGAGFNVLTARDGAEALDRIRAKLPDLVLTDVMMPKLDGVGLLKALRSSDGTRNLPVILLSARAGEEARIEGLEQGADDYLIKPFSAREVTARIGTALALARARHLRESALREEARLNALLYERAKATESRQATLFESERVARGAAEQAARIKDQFLATISHELRTPLNAIVGWVSVLQSSNAKPADVQRAVEVIKRNAQAQAQLIEDLLDMSRIVTGKVRLDVQPVLLSAVIESAITSVLPAAGAKDIRVGRVLDGLAGPIKGDPGRLQQVMWNLLTNAIKFTPKGGRVQVTLERVNSHLEIAVSDTGIGIEPEFLPMVFDRFRQADSSASRQHSGLGLGLAISKELIELHGGTIRVKSPGKGAGAMFIISLPLAPLAEERQDESRQHPRTVRREVPDDAPGLSLEGLKVLAVEDEPDALELIGRVLTDAGASVQCCSNGPDALAALALARFDVMVSDLGMAGMDGYTLIRTVRQLPDAQGGATPAIALTAFARSEDRQRAYRAGFQMHAAKPVDPAELMTIVAALTRNGQARCVQPALLPERG
jgi:signal transduction histidine kinase